MSSSPLPDLEARFLPSDNWQEKYFINPETQHSIRYCEALIQAPIGTIICLPGLSEFCEKYIETAQFFNAQGYNFYVLDWAYQGLSTRFDCNPHKRTSNGYETDISDLDYLINHHIQSNAPLYMLGHSMGGHIGLRYLATQNHAIKVASFSAPMLAIKSLKYVPSCIRFILFPLRKFYIAGGKDWCEQARKSDGTDIFSTDPIRDQIHQVWPQANPTLKIGNVTYKWVFESLKSIAFMKKEDILEKISIPTLLVVAEQEELVDNDAIVRASTIIPNAQLLDLHNAKHEIMMETDNIRDEFLNQTLALFKQ